MDQTPSLFAQALASLLRSWLSAAAGAMVTAGILTGDQSTQFVTVGVALITWGASYVWSLIQKRSAKKALNHAIAAPAGLAK